MNSKIGKDLKILFFTSDFQNGVVTTDKAITEYLEKGETQFSLFSLKKKKTQTNGRSIEQNVIVLV